MADDFETVRANLIAAVSAAIKAGYVVTVEQVPNQPLAMGNYKHRIDLRPRRVYGTYLTKENGIEALAGKSGN